MADISPWAIISWAIEENLLVMLSKNRIIPNCLLNTHPYTLLFHAPPCPPCPPCPPPIKEASFGSRDWSKWREWLTMGPRPLLVHPGQHNLSLREHGDWESRKIIRHKDQGSSCETVSSIYNKEVALPKSQNFGHANKTWAVLMPIESQMRMGEISRGSPILRCKSYRQLMVHLQGCVPK